MFNYSPVYMLCSFLSNTLREKKSPATIVVCVPLWIYQYLLKFFHQKDRYWVIMSLRRIESLSLEMILFIPGSIFLLKSILCDINVAISVPFGLDFVKEYFFLIFKLLCILQKSIPLVNCVCLEHIYSSQFENHSI